MRRTLAFHLAALDGYLVAFVLERGGLGGDDLQIGVDAANVAIVEDLYCGLGSDGGVMLLLRFQDEGVEDSEVVFDLLEGGEGGLAVVGCLFVVAGDGLLRDCAAAAGIEEGLRERRADTPDVVRAVDEGGDRGALEAGEGREVECGEVGGAGDADALVGLVDAALGGGDVGTALEKLRWQADRNGWRQRVERLLSESEAGGRLADEHGDGVLELGSLDVDVRGLNAGAFELRLGLVDVGLAGDAALEAVVGDAVGLFVGLDGVEEELLVGVVGARFEVVDGELGLEAEEGGLKDRRRWPGLLPWTD